MLFSPGKKMAILMLLTILILSLLLESFTREGMDVATVVNEDAPKESDQDQSSSKQSSSPDKQSSSPDKQSSSPDKQSSSSGKQSSSPDKQSSSKQSSSPDGIQLPDGKKPITVSEITSILAKNQAVKDLLK